jgi:LAO/AO transport system kinase
MMLAPSFNADKKIPVLKTIASTKEGIDALCSAIKESEISITNSDRKHWLMADRVYQLIQRNKMKGIDKAVIKKDLAAAIQSSDFNLFRFTQAFLNDKQ